MNEIDLFLEKVRSQHFEASTYWAETRALWEKSKLQEWFFGIDLETRDRNISEIFSQFPETRSSFMTEKESHKLKALPNFVTIYRGGQQSNIAGWSWTLDYNSAKKFAYKIAKDRRPLLATVTDFPVEGILAFTENPNSEELIIDPLTITLESAEFSKIRFERIKS